MRSECSCARGPQVAVAFLVEASAAYWTHKYLLPVVDAALMLQLARDLDGWILDVPWPAHHSACTGQ